VENINLNSGVVMGRLSVFAVLVLFIAGFACAADLSITTMNYDPAPAVPGSYVKLWFHLTNNSNQAAKDVVFKLDLERPHGNESYPFSLDEGEDSTKRITVIKARQTAVIEFNVRIDSGALSKTYKIKTLFGDEGKAIKKSEYSIHVLNRNPEIEIIGSEPAESSAGKVLELNLQLRNIGYDTARDIMAGIQEDRTVTTTGVVVERMFSSAGSGLVYAGNLGPGEEQAIKLRVAINPEAELKTYNIPITIKYKDTNLHAYSVTRYAGIMLKQDAEIDAVISSVSPKPYPGGNSEIMFDLFNIGAGDAKYVVVEVSSDYGLLDMEKVFIGTLEPDDFDSFKIKADLNSNIRAGQIPIKLTISYKDSYSAPKIMEKTLALTIYSRGEAVTQGGIDFWFLVVLVIALYYGGKRVYKRVKKH
jgi:hypothetical protein